MSGQDIFQMRILEACSCCTARWCSQHHRLDHSDILDWVFRSFWTASWDRSKCAIRTPACTVPLDIQDTWHGPVLLHRILSWRGAGYEHKDRVDTAIMTVAHPALLLVRPDKFSESSCCMPFQENSVQLSQDMVHHRFDSDWACFTCLCLCCPICFVWWVLNLVTLVTAIPTESP